MGIDQAEAYIFPTAFAQQRLWFFEQLSPNTALYNVAAAMQLTGKLNVGALKAAVSEMIRRHESLRSTFKVVEDQLVQAIIPWSDCGSKDAARSISVSHFNFQQISKAEREVLKQKFILEETQRPFDLVHGPLLRVKLLQLEPTEHVLLLTLHHIISDGWSIGVIMRELGALYTAFAAKKPSPLPDLPVQYADFAQWQRQWFQGEIVETQLAYWQQQLAELPAINLPVDRPRPPAQSYQGRTQHLELSLTLTQALESLSQQLQVTLFVTLLTAFKTLLYRYSGQTDIAVGSPIANRNISEVEGLIGFFVNTLVIRTDLSDNPTFRSLLERVRSVAFDAYSHQDLPFEKLVEALQPDRSLSQTPLVQVMFALQSAPTPPLQLEGLTLKFLEVESRVAKFDLTLSVERTTQGLKGSLEYSTDLFEADTIDRLLQHFRILIEGIVENPDCLIAELPLLSAAERQQLLVDWNQTQTDYPQERCVHQLFEAQVERTPDAVAVRFVDRALTYRELNNQANHLAHQLQNLGVKSEVLVGLYCDRTPELIVGMLAILKAGGAFVSFDPNSPVERLSFMLKDAQVSILLTQKHWIESFTGDAKILCIDRDEAAIEVNNPASNITPNNLAYVIYTSGSTGQPKGVLIEHRGLLNLVFWHQRNFQVSPSDRATQIASPAFDACGWEILPYLAAGASIHIPNESTRISPEKLRDWLISEQITLCFLPTPLAEHMLPLDWSGTALRSLLVGGDRLRSCPPARLPFAVVNNYGATENTVVATSGVVSASQEILTIGRPIANTQIYLLDANLRLVPVGASGEIYIGGDGLARGYLDRPEQTESCFVLNPFGAGKSRLYRTGDLARYRSSGDLEFQGRLDQQAKIRGFRIELGEVESAIAQHPSVQSAVVLAKEFAAIDRRLIAYVVADVSTAKLRQFLKEKLPDYMIPTVFVLLEKLPLTVSGKIDRLALTSLEVSIESTEVVAPQSAIETTLVQLWAELLELKQISTQDSFFTLGGHSLLATQLVSRIRDVLQIDVPLALLFESPTIAGIAEYIETVKWATPRQSVSAADRSCEEVEF